MAIAVVVYKLSELVKHIGGELIGHDVTVNAIASLESAKSGELSFYTGTKFSTKAAKCAASALVVKQHNADYTGSQIITKDPQLFIARVLSLLYPIRQSKQVVHQSAAISDTARVDPSAEIGAFVVVESGAQIGPYTIIEAGTFIGENVVVGANCWIHPRVVIYPESEVGDATEIHSGAVIGSDGFGNAWNGNHWEKIQQIGKVIIGSHVEIGANTTIDRGALDNTIISDGARLDNLIQIAHNVKIGAHTAIAGCSGIAGSASVGSNCLIGGGVLIAGHIEIASGVTILSGSGTSSSITEPGVYANGVPSMPYSDWVRNSSQYRRLDEIAKRLKKIEKMYLINNSVQLGDKIVTD